MTTTASTSRLVYSTDAGRTCPQCRHALQACVCAHNRTWPASPDGVLRVRRETKGRGGKTVTSVDGIGGSDNDIATLGKQLKNACGSGGTSKDGRIEIQGDHVERVIAALIKLGHRARKTGG